MDPLALNKWVAALLASVLLILLINTYTDSIFGTGQEDGDDKLAYSVEIEEAATIAVASDVAAPSLNELLAIADANKGAREFGKCKGCHTAESGGKVLSGPNLYNLVGSKIGGAEGFKYSKALTGQAGTWDYDTLDAWIAAPKKKFPGTSMGYSGMKKATSRANLIAFLRTNADSPVSLPAAAVETLVEEIVDDVTK